MTEKDKQELEILRTQLQCLQTQANEHRHRLVSLQVHASQQEQRLSRLLAMLGLLPTDLDAPGALTAEATLLLRLSRPEN